jgi:hypothetical protein
MPVESLDFSYKTKSDLVLSVADLKSKYFFGIPIVTPDGSLMPDEDIEYYIRAAQTELETTLDIKLRKQVVTETKDFLMEHYKNWGYIKATYPVSCINSITGFIGTTRQVEYPEEWFTIRKTNDDIVHRSINIVPTNNGSAINQSVVYSGIYPQLGYYGSRTIPSYWNLKYVSGFDEIPSDLIRVMGMMAAIPIYDLLGNLVLRAGIASQSIGLDGLSESIGTTQSAENHAFSATVKTYQNQIKLIMPELKKRYTGLTFGTM